MQRSIKTLTWCADATDKDIASVPPPKQLVWIHLGGGRTNSRNSSEYDLSLVCLDVTGDVEEHRIGAGVARKPGRGIDALGGGPGHFGDGRGGPVCGV